MVYWDDVFKTDDIEEEDRDNQEELKQSDDEMKFLSVIEKDRLNAESTKQGDRDNDITDIETTWEDEYYMKKGGGLQWSTSFAYRSTRSRQVRPNSEDNFVFNAVEIIKANITASDPTVNIEGTEQGDKEIADKITDMSIFNDERNNFSKKWSKSVDQFISYGPICWQIIWDNDWMGGYGENRWIGDVKLVPIRKEDFYPDPSIIALDEDLQDGSYHIVKTRTKVASVRKRWKNGKFVNSELPNNTGLENEGSDPKMCDLIQYWHRGKPKFMPKSRKNELFERADFFMSEGDEYRSRDYEDMASGKVDGIHVAYVANGVLLEYRPYEYEHGLYPFVFRTRYHDEHSQWGYGEIRNIKIPQIMHNKADEIEIEAYSRQGLGGMYYEEGSVSPKQLDEIKRNAGKGGVWLAIKNIFKIKEREPVQVPSSLPAYKEHKQRMCETVSQVTPIQQGMSPSANMPYKALAELGARTDIRLKQAVDILQDFLKEVNKLRILLFAQFYTEDRYYRIKGNDGKTKEGTLNRSEMMLSWEREEILDPISGEVIGYKQEYFVPDFDIKVNILDERPKDRNYYTQTGFTMFDRGVMTMEDLWYTLEEGKLPPKEEAIKKVQAQNVAFQISSLLQNIDPQTQQGILQEISQISMISQQQQNMQQMMQKQQTKEMLKGGAANGQMQQQGQQSQQRQGQNV